MQGVVYLSMMAAFYSRLRTMTRPAPKPAVCLILIAGPVYSAWGGLAQGAAPGVRRDGEPVRAVVHRRRLDRQASSPVALRVDHER